MLVRTGSQMTPTSLRLPPTRCVLKLLAENVFPNRRLRPYEVLVAVKEAEYTETYTNCVQATGGARPEAPWAAAFSLEFLKIHHQIHVNEHFSHESSSLALQ